MFANITGNITNGFTRHISTTMSTNTTAIVPKTSIIALSVLGAIVIIENLCVCVAFATNSYLRKRQSNILVCSQAAIDLLVGLVFIPWLIAELFTNKNLYTGYIVFYVLFVSLGNLSCLALDRYLALIKPLKHHLLMDVSRTKKILLIAWLTPLFLTMIPLSWHSSSIATQHIAMKIYLSIFWVVMLIMCITMIVMYVRVYRTAAKTISLRQKRLKSSQSHKESKIKSTRKELRVAHLFGLLLFFFILAYLPLLVANLCLTLLELKATRALRFIQQSVIYSLVINSLVNPILCLLLKRDYQMTIRRWICCEWVSDRRRDDSLSQRSHSYCKTGVSDLDSNDVGAESKRRASGHSKAAGRSLKVDAKARFSCREAKVVLITNRPHSRHLKAGENEINENEILSSHEFYDECLQSPIISQNVDLD